MFHSGSLPLAEIFVPTGSRSGFSRRLQTIQMVEELKPILPELRACGRNLNQLTMLAHEGHIQTVDLWETGDMLGKTYEAVNALMRYISQSKKTLDRHNLRFPRLFPPKGRV